MDRPLAREVAYDAIDGEREYQDARLGNSRREGTDDNRDLGSLILLMDAYLHKVKTAYAGPHPEGKFAALDQIRKVTALGILAMEKHGAMMRILT